MKRAVTFLLLTVCGCVLLSGVFLAARIATADAESVAMTVRRHLPYDKPKDAPRRLTSLDVYAPKTGSDHPVMIFIHGGGWRFGDKRGVHDKPQAFVKRGFVFVSINYRFHPDVNYRQQAGDVATAVKFVHDHVHKVGGDRKRIYLMGHSAGAHLAALVATDHRYLKQAGLTLSALKGVVLLDGAGYDIPRQIRITRRRRSKQLYETVFGTNETTQRDASPIAHVKRGTGIPPFLILYCAHRRDAGAQSQAFASALNKAGVKAQAVPMKGTTHLRINRELGRQDDEPTRVMFTFLKTVEESGGKQ